VTLLKDTNKTPRVVSVAVPVPLRQSFDFLVADNAGDPVAGARVRIPFGTRELVGVILHVSEESNYPLNKLKSVIEILDDQSLFDESLWQSLQWISRYYLAPIGDVLDTALTVLLRQGAPVMPATTKTWALTDHGRSSPVDELNRAPLQLAIIKRFMSSTSLSSEDFKQESRSWRQAVNALVEKQWLEEYEDQPQLSTRVVPDEPVLVLNDEQKGAAEDLIDKCKQNVFSCTLLHGVTGSGKTEVYFSAIDAVLGTSGMVAYTSG